jgi:hypothetical protein
MLTAHAGSWLGNEGIAYAYEWQRCDVSGSACEAIEGADAATYLPGAVDVGHTLRVLVDASETGGAVAEFSPVTQPIAAEGAPTPLQAPELSGTTLVGSTLSATSPGAWTSSGPLSYGYQWQRCDEQGEECTTISGATASSYTPTQADAGAAVRVLVSATDASGSSSAVSPPLIVSDSALSRVSGPSISGADQLGRALSAEPGIWTGSGAIAFGYAWRQCDADREGCQSISGAGGPIYSPRSGDAGHAIEVEVTATDGSDAATAFSMPTPPISAEATTPEDTAAPSIEGNLTVGQTLSATAGAWSGSEPLSFAYQWQRCSAGTEECVDIEGASAATYTLSEADAGSAVRVSVAASNSAGSASAVSSESEAVGLPGPPVDTQEPAITGAAREGEGLLAETGNWSGSRPLSFSYGWERCNSAGEACSEIAGATDQTYTAGSSDVGARLRVRVTAVNALDSASALSAPTPVVVSATEASVSPALEAIERTDPSIVAPSASAQVEEQQLAPALADAGEQLASSSTLTSSTVSKTISGEFAVATPIGEVSFTPVEPSESAARMPTIVNGAASLFAETWRESDTVVRSSALGATTLLQLRSASAPTSFSWEVGLGAGQRLEQLADGSVAIVEPPAETAFEEPPGEGLASSQPPAGTSAEDVGGEASESHSTGSLAEEGGLAPLPAAPTASTPAATPKEGELHPQDTQAVFERAKGEMTRAEAEAGGSALAVIEPPTVLDAAGNSVPATLSVSDDKITLSLTPASGASFPVTAELASAAPTDLVNVARDPVRYGISDPKAPVFGNGSSSALDPHLNGPPLHVRVARDVIPWFTSYENPKLQEWLRAVHAARLEPYITLEYGGKPFCVGSKCAGENATYKTKVEELVKGLIELHSEDGTIPMVKLWGAWNEPDNSRINPLAGNAGEAALLWKIAHQAITSHCACMVAAGEFTGYSGYIGRYVSAILHDHRYGSALPHAWGLHDYADLVQLHYHQQHHEGNVTVDRFVRAVDGQVGKPRIWISETGVLLHSGGSATELRTSPNHQHLQIEAANDLLRLSQASSRIEIVNNYLYLGPSLKYIHEGHPQAFDSALVAGEGVKEAQVPREAYCVLALRKSKGCSAMAKTKGPVHGSAHASSVSVLASIDPRGLATTYSFVYGRTTSYGQSSSVAALPSEEGEQSATATLQGLRPCTTYHYEVTAENEGNEGTPSLGGDQTFTTTCEHAVVQDSSCQANTLAGNDDQSTGEVHLPFAVDFYGNTFHSLYVNNNGNVTFGQSMSAWKPIQFASVTRPLIAAFWADVDTRAAGSNLVTYGTTTFAGHPAFCADWPYVGYWSEGMDKLNDFQLMLVGREDVAPGAFEIIFNYDQVQWETGTFDGGVDGLGGVSAGIGFTLGDGSSAHTFEMPGSRQNGAFLDSNTQTGLIHGSRGSAVAGRYAFDMFP